jgi:hypothetical protein
MRFSAKLKYYLPIGSLHSKSMNCFGISFNSYLPIYDVTLELAPIVFQQFCFLL